MKKALKNTLIVAASSVLAATAATLVTGKVFSNLATKRRIITLPEKMISKLTGGADKDPNLLKITEAEERARQIETESVMIDSHDGLKLKADFFPAKEQKRIVIAMHGWRSSWQFDFGSIIDFLHDEGCSILFPHQRGQGESDGEYISFGVLERYDCLEWIKYITHRNNGEVPIYLFGISMGATTVLMTSGFELPECVKGIVADCGFTTPHAIWSSVSNSNLHVSDKILYPIVNFICSRTAQFSGDEYSTTEALKESKVPVLFIHGSADTFVPLEMTFENYQVCGSEKELLIVPGAGHGMSYVVDGNIYRKVVKKMFKKYD